MSAATEARDLSLGALTPLIGREREIEAVARLALREDVRLLTLVGPPGIGKTRLALAVAERLRNTLAAGGGPVFADGVWLVPLAAVTDPGLVLPSIARAIILAEGSSSALVRQLQVYLQDRVALLVLDNFEQVLPAAAGIADLLAAAPALTVLVTSRAAVRLSAEHLFPVPPLALPPPVPGVEPVAGGAGGPAACADDLARYESVRLFVARAQAVQPDFALMPENGAHIAAICRRLEGLPLAIELAAARIPLLPPSSLLRRLEQRIGLLTGGARDLPVRHQTLRGAIAWSYDLLDEGEQAVFRRLGVFVGGCSLDAAEAVCRGQLGTLETAAGSRVSGAAPEAPTGGAVPPCDSNVLEQLASLVEKSLVRQEADPGGEPRLRMLETIREYALERLEAQGEAEDARRRHAQWALDLVEAAQPSLEWRAFAERKPWLDRLEAEHANLQAALAWSHAAPAATADGGALGLRLAAALGQFWRRGGHWSEGRRWLAGALALPAAAGPSAARARALQDGGTMAAWQGHHSAGRASLEAAVALWRALGDRQGLAWTLSDLAWPLLNLGEPAAAQSAAAESAALCRELDDRPGHALALRWLGNALDARADASAADRRQAEALWEQSLRLFQEAGDDEGASMPLNMLAGRARMRGDYAAAQSMLEQAVALRRKTTGGAHVAHVLAPLGELAEIDGDAALAEQYTSEALERFRAAGHLQGTARALVRLGDLAARRGGPSRAAALYPQGLTLARQGGDADLIARALAGQADLARQAGDLARARALHGEGVDVLLHPANRRPDALGNAGARARCLIGLAWVEVAQGRPTRAARLLGAVPGFMSAIGRSLEPPDTADHAAAVAAARAAADESALAAAIAEGQAMSPEQAMAYAIQAEEPPSPAPALGKTAIRRRAAGGLAVVTPREGEVARLVAEDLTNLDIANTLHITERTVENHVAHILTKLGFRSRVQIATWVVEQSLTHVA